jgi:hypothetical protein
MPQISMRRGVEHLVLVSTAGKTRSNRYETQTVTGRLQAADGKTAETPVSPTGEPRWKNKYHIAISNSPGMEVETTEGLAGL